jgi:hypothetical protein
VNIVTELFDEPDFPREFRFREQPLPMAEVLARLAIAPSPTPAGERDRPADNFEPVDVGWLERGQLWRAPVGSVPTTGGEAVLGRAHAIETLFADWEHGDAVWLEARYLGGTDDEVAVYPNDNDPSPRVMTYAGGEPGEGELTLQVVSAELQIGRDGKRWLTGLYLRHLACPPGTSQGGEVVCPAGPCPIGTCTRTSVQTTTGPLTTCYCHHGGRRGQ